MNHHILEKIRNIINSVTTEINMIIDNEIYGDSSDFIKKDVEIKQNQSQEIKSESPKPISMEDFINPKFKGSSVEKFITSVGNNNNENTNELFESILKKISMEKEKNEK
jgi:hypothetical protein